MVSQRPSTAPPTHGDTATREHFPTPASSTSSSLAIHGLTRRVILRSNPQHHSELIFPPIRSRCRFQAPLKCTCHLWLKTTKSFSESMGGSCLKHRPTERLSILVATQKLSILEKLLLPPAELSFPIRQMHQPNSGEWPRSRRILKSCNLMASTSMSRQRFSSIPAQVQNPRQSPSRDRHRVVAT